MSLSMIFFTVIITGLGCGIGCGSLSTPILIGKMIGEERTTKQCMVATGIFSLGKVLMYMFLGLLSTIFGSVVIENLQTVYPGITQFIFRIISIMFGIIIIVNVFRSNKCGSCKRCRINNMFLNKFKDSSYFVIGVIYAVIPCSPLIIALTYAAGMDTILAILLMMCFGIVNSIFSVIIYAPIVGKIIESIKEEIPEYYRWIQVFSAVMLMGMSIFVF